MNTPIAPARRPPRRAGWFAACLLAVVAQRAGGHGDPFVIDYQAATNQLTVTPAVYDVFNVDENLATPGFGFPITTISPGFSRADGLPANTAVSVRFTSPLTYWNPTTGPIEPLPIASGTISLVNAAAATTTVAAAGVGGSNPLFIATFIGRPGEHHHVTAYELGNPDAPGLYGLWAEATATGPAYPTGGTAPSAAFLIVLNWGIEDEQQYHDGVTRLAAPPDPMISITVGSGTQTQSQAGYPLLAGTTPVVKAGGGTLVVDQANTLTGSTTILQGTVLVTHPASLAASRVVPLATGTLAVAPCVQTTLGGLVADAGGMIDVGGGMITVSSGLSVSDTVTAILTGLGDGSWNGTSGIRSGAAAADTASGIPRAVGWLDHGDGAVTFGYAAPGDTNLDWQVDILDASNFVASGLYGTAEHASWVQGDFTYDGVVDVLDAAGFLATGLFGAGGYLTVSGGTMAIVPEPGPVATMVAVAAALIWKPDRWRRSSDSSSAGIRTPR